MCRVGGRGFDAAYSFGDYTGALRRLIHLLKYRRVQALTQPFGAWLTQALPLDEQLDVVVPVPLHWTREFSRGFNQAELLAREITRRRGLPYAPALRRIQATTSQARMSRSERRRNVATAFVARRPAAIAGKTVLLIDDVHTTGATLGACALALKRAGAKRVVALTLARVDRRESVEPIPRSRAAAGGYST